MYLVIQVVSWRLADAKGPVGLTEIVHSWARWDSGAYVWIAEHGGYPPVTDPTFTHDPYSVYTSWPPFYPLVIRAFSYVLPWVSFTALAVLVANLGALGMLIVLYRLMDHELDKADGDRAVFYLMAFPTAFFFAMAYSESLYLFLAVTALYLARRDRWWAAGAVAATVGATRIVGILIIVALAYEYLRQRDFQWRRIGVNVLSFGLVPVGLALYVLYCWRRFGDPLIFSHAQVFFDRKGFAAPWTSIYWMLQFDQSDRSTAFIHLLDLSIMLLVMVFLVLGLVGPWRLRRDQFYLWLFGAVPYAVAVLQPSYPHVIPFAGMNRYALMILPVFMVLAKMGRSLLFERLYLLAALPIQTGLMVLFIRFDWAG
jgi:hypothetical protein